MSQIELNYEELEQKIINEIKKHEFGVLATSENDYVRAGLMRLIKNGLTIYCMVDKNTRKYKQITANPNIALVVNNIQIEGVASDNGKMIDSPDFIQTYKETQPKAYESSVKKGHFERTEFRVVEIKPKRVAFYKGIDVKTGSLSHLDILNIMKHEAHRVTWLTKDMDSLNIMDSQAYRQ